MGGSFNLTATAVLLWSIIPDNGVGSAKHDSYSAAIVAVGLVALLSHL